MHNSYKLINFNEIDNYIYEDKPELFLYRYMLHNSYYLVVNNIIVGRVLFYYLFGNCVKLYSFEIFSSYKGKGYANQFLTLIKDKLKVNKFKSIKLVVEKENIIAYNLYIKNNFLIHSIEKKLIL